MSDQFFKKLQTAIASGPIRTDRREKPDFTHARLFDKNAHNGNLSALFAERSVFSGATTHQLGSVDELVTKITQIVTPGSEIIIDPTLACAETLIAKLSANYKVHQLGQTSDDTLFSATAAITGVDFAVAETGSVILSSNERRQRLTSLVVEIHFALIRPDQIIPDWLDVDAKQKEFYSGKVPGGLTVITGPSKTADIEMNLVIGVHGPGQMHMVLLPEK
jgi:L-lactate dehydrogenase complex protein LldG